MSHSHGAADMDGMDMGSGSSSSSSESMHMMSIFQTNINTSLYSTAWTPTTVGAYAGTCIFLVLLALGFRLLLWGKARAEARWLDAEIKRRYVVVQGKPALSERIMQGGAGEVSKGTLVLSENGIEENVVVLQKRDSISTLGGGGGENGGVVSTHRARPWRMSVDPLRALFDTIIVGVGYML